MDWLTTSTVLAKLHDYEEQSAWSMLADHFREPLLRFSMRLGLNRNDAQDAVQETLLAFAQAYRKGSYDRSKGRLKSWLFGIAHRQALNLRRRHLAKHAQNQADLTASLSEVDRLEEKTSELEAWWDREWMRSLYERCVKIVRAEVTPQTFEMFRRVALLDENAEDVAAEFGVARTTVYNAKHRVSGRIAELVKQMDDA